MALLEHDRRHVSAEVACTWCLCRHGPVVPYYKRKNEENSFVLLRIQEGIGGRVRQQTSTKKIQEFMDSPSMMTHC